MIVNPFTQDDDRDLTIYEDTVDYLEFFPHWDTPTWIMSGWSYDGRVEWFVSGRDFATPKR